MDPCVTVTVTANKPGPFELDTLPGPLSAGVREGPSIGPTETAQQPPQQASTEASTCSNTLFVEEVVSGVATAGDAIAALGAYTGVLPVAAAGKAVGNLAVGINIGINAGQGDAQGLTEELASFSAGLVPGGRIARRVGGATLDVGRNAKGQFKTGGSRTRAATDIAIQSGQGRAAGALVSGSGCTR